MKKIDYRDPCYSLNNNIETFMWIFLEKYFAGEDWKFEWEFSIVEDSSSNELKYNLFVNDMYFSLQDIYYALRYDIPLEILEKWYWERTDEMLKWDEWKVVPNLKNYYLLHKEDKDE